MESWTQKFGSIVQSGDAGSSACAVRRSDPWFAVGAVSRLRGRCWLQNGDLDTRRRSGDSLYSIARWVWPRASRQDASVHARHGLRENRGVKDRHFGISLLRGVEQSAQSVSARSTFIVAVAAVAAAAAAAAVASSTLPDVAVADSASMAVPRADNSPEGLFDPSAYQRRTDQLIFAAFISMTLFNSLELIVLCFGTFKRRQGLYFWSLLVASACLIPYAIGFLLIFFHTGVNPYLPVTLIVFPWMGMVTGQSLVLYSRLHLVCQNPKVLHAVRWMIIINAFCLHIPTAVLIYGDASPSFPSFAFGYSIMERIQVVGFCLQELIISGIYVWETVKLLRLRPQGCRRGIFNQLLVINIVILAMDLAVVGIEYAGYYPIQVTLKAFVYSIKLKLEYSILGKLVLVAKGACSLPDPASSGYEPDSSLSQSQSQCPSHSLPSSRRTQSSSSPAADWLEEFEMGLPYLHPHAAYS
ncbi:hypothetical protein ASPZODRAFT_17324 [Penicilliopsis zonata CBS 506.65]|uniref:DUF7703 domain-containing protein n=1 Tax=Penicilliopsis zonata CBS 506.65 TaxID=1073090 RepID=A0A1L9SF99_9EURO|nr:hypothetical protein ASPZODRAFT_17324 [Penicilliopsis zonata CBS 506.65]OJJ45890.1 hypothetical protein ASPZODRAFT_17324 [Penicilliopsis zonata CBS 506.65]